MEDITELLIYIAFIVLSMIGGLYKNYAKRKAEEKKMMRREEDHVISDSHVPTQAEEKQVTNPFEEMIRKGMEDFFEEPVAEESIADESEIVGTEISKEGEAVFNVTEEELLSDNMREEGFSITDELAEKEKSDVDSIKDTEYKYKEEELKEMSIMDNFDPVDAIIYSEIMQRPNY